MPTLGVVRMKLPEPGEISSQSELIVSVMFTRPIQRRPQVVVVELQTLQPKIPCFHPFAVGASGNAEEVAEVTILRRQHFVELRQPCRRVLATQDRHLSASSGGLLSALILLAGIPGSSLGGYWADRSKNLRAFIVGPLLIVAVLLALIPAVPTGALWVLGIGIGFFLIFGFAAWLAVPARVCDIDHAYIGTATGLMLTLAAVGGFFIPILFGHLFPHTSYTTGWIFLAAVSFAFAIVGLIGHNPAAQSTPRRKAHDGNNSTPPVGALQVATGSSSATAIQQTYVSPREI
jgi:hypothetical protein